MKVRRSIAAAGAAVVLGTTGALPLPAVASASSATHTLKFTAVQVKSGHVHQDEPAPIRKPTSTRGQNRRVTT